MEVMICLFGFVLVVCILSFMFSDKDYMRDKDRHSYFVDLNYRSSIFHKEKDEHHL